MSDLVVATTFYPYADQANESRQEKEELNKTLEQNKVNQINLVPSNTQIGSSMPQGIHMPITGIQQNQTVSGQTWLRAGMQQCQYSVRGR